MQLKLHAKASALGLDDAAYARMLIYRDVNGVEQAAPAVVGDRALGSAADHRRRAYSPAIAERQTLAHTSRELDEPADEPPIEELVDADEPRAEDMDIPPDADDAPAGLDAILSAAPSMLDDMIARAGGLPAVQQPGRQVALRGPRNYRSAAPALSYGPGSRTRAVGVNDGVVGSNNFGDGHGNVLRDNMRHFGISGTRARG